MNTIAAEPFQSLYAHEPHLALWVDGIPLDQLLDRRIPNQDLEGLVPAWLEWMLNEQDQAVAQSRMLLPSKGDVRVSLLMCPDDLDFSCSIVVADLEATETKVMWNRLGYDKTRSHESNEIGADVDWFKELAPFCFQRSQYERCILEFKDENQRTKKTSANHRSGLDL
ncbi:MAG: hypothetical protein ACSHYA_10890 [Opitutaceae bacterium]